MQNVLITKPYKFVPRWKGTWIPSLFRDLGIYKRFLRKSEGVYSHEIRHLDRLKKCLRDGDSIILVPNHSRTADPMLMGHVAREARCLVYAMASWHLFNQSKMYAWAVRTMGGFSVNRERIDKQAIDTAIEILVDAERPLILFPEGTTSRTNDLILPFLEGVSVIARSAAKKRLKKGLGRLVMIPIGIKYVFRGDIVKSCMPIIRRLEKRITWQVQESLPLVQRIRKLAVALLSIKEIEYFNESRSGSVTVRQNNLIEHLLTPLEQKWLNIQPNTTCDIIGVVARVKNLRTKILPYMIENRLSETVSAQCWRELSDTYLAQQISCYPNNYLDEFLSVDRIRETVERLEEDVTDTASLHTPLHAVIHIDEPIEISGKRERGSGRDPLMPLLESRIQGILDELKHESSMYAGN
jgi:1-acyl-sn-glycerol-3-phosphate acyltransferase